MLKFQRKLAKYYINFRGWKTRRKIVVIESDDWGSIRMASLRSYINLLNKGYPVNENKFTSLDGLERTDDLKQLFKILRKHQDKKGNHPVITACSVVANPDFKKIEASDFSKYHFETIDKTYETCGEPELLDLWKEEGIKNNLLFPQFHGREHLNPQKWMSILNNGSETERAAFNENTLLGLSQAYTSSDQNYMAAFESVNEAHKEEIKKIAIDGLAIFEKIFGFKSISFMPSQSKQFDELNETLMHKGVRFNQGGQHFIKNEDNTFKKVDKFWGDTDDYGMTYWRRNCSFEPYKNQNDNHVDSCLKDMEIAFRCGKPAVINSHRINFTSRIDAINRDLSLEKLDDLLKKILIKWPDVEFMNSAQLASVLEKR
jgi:hypothetical protein